MTVDDFPELFLTICAENSHENRPKYVLIEILKELEANRSHILTNTNRPMVPMPS